MKYVNRMLTETGTKEERPGGGLTYLCEILGGDEGI
jgi:hypothetical protein